MAFDRSGQIVGRKVSELLVHQYGVLRNDLPRSTCRYRKANLYGGEEAVLDKVAAGGEAVSFVTDSGLRVGVLTCFDVLFQQPAKKLLEMPVDAIALPVAWGEELPFLTGCARYVE